MRWTSIVVVPVLLFLTQGGEEEREVEKLLNELVNARNRIFKLVSKDKELFPFLREKTSNTESLYRFVAYTDSSWGGIHLHLVILNPEIPSLIGSDDESKRLEALKWLRGREEAGSVELLIGALSDKSVKVSNAAVEALGALKDKRATEHLLRLLVHEEEETRQLLLIEALGELKDERAVGRLLSLLRHRNPLVASKAAESLGKIGNRGVVPVLVEVAKGGTVEAVRYSAVFALGDIGDKRAVRVLLPLLKAVSGRLRYAAAYALGSIGDEEALDGLMEALTDGEWGVRWAAARGIGRISEGRMNRRAVSHLIDALLDENEPVRKEALSALKRITGQDFGTDHKRWSEWLRRQQ